MLALPIMLMLAVLAPAGADADAGVRHEDGWHLLDAGRNTEAEAHFTALMQSHDAGCAAARGLAEARRRACLPPVALETTAPGLDRFTRGEILREAGDLTRALEAFRRAGAAARGQQDVPGAAAALLEAADCALQSGRFASADTLVLQLRALLPALDAAAAARAELAIRVREAGIHYLAGRFDAADSLYAAAAAAALEAGRTTEACDALNGRGSVASRQRRVDASRRDYAAALDLARHLGDSGRQAKILLNFAYDEIQARNFIVAEGILAEAGDLITACGRDHLLGRVHMVQGALAEGRGDRDGAVGHFRAACLELEAVGDRGGELGARQWLGYNLMMAGHYGEASRHYERALALTDTLASPQVLNWVLAGLALTNHRLGWLDRAEDYYNRAMALNEALGDRMSVAWCHHSLGLLEVLRGNYREAMIHNLAALEICTGLGDQEGVGEARVALADIHFRLGDWDRAVAEFEAAADVAREHGLEELLQGAVTGLAAVCTAAGQPARARAYCEEGLAIARRWRDSNAVVWALVELAEQSLAQGDRDDARARLAEAETRLWPRGPHVLRARTRLAQARCADDPQAALVLAEAALAQAEAGGLPEQEWVCLTELGVLRLAAGDTSAALADQDRAITVIESLRRNAGSDDLRLHMLRSALLPYERIVALLATRDAPGDRALAFAYAERSRARILAERLRVAASGRAAAPLGDEERDVLASIAHCQDRLQAADLPDSARAGLKRRAAALETDFLRLKLRTPDAAGPPLADATALPDPVALAALPRAGEHVVAYFLGRDASWTFHVAAGRVTIHPLPPRDEVESLVRRYLALRESPETRPGQLETASRRLHELLLAPALAGAQPAMLIIVPDGLLHRLPFAALTGAAGGAPAVDCPGFTVPSLQALDALRRRHEQRRAARGVPTVPLVAVGYGGPGAETRLHPWQDRPFAPVPQADEEVRQVAALFRGALVLTGPEAGERALAAAPLAEAAILHLAAHGDADDREVRRSFVLLGRSGDGEDGLLQWSEAAALELGTSLVTLASCRSARGPLAVGEGVTGLTQAFLFAGASCVLAAQTDVGDAFSRRFMLDFYRHLRRGETTAGALRLAQLAAAADDSSGRAAWADFVLVGDGAVTVTGAAPAPLGGPLPYAAAGLALAVFGIRAVRRRRRV